MSPTEDLDPIRQRWPSKPLLTHGRGSLRAAYSTPALSGCNPMRPSGSRGPSGWQGVSPRGCPMSAPDWNLARRAVACSHWRWMPGCSLMPMSGWWALTEGIPYGHSHTAGHRVWLDERSLPDLRTRHHGLLACPCAGGLGQPPRLCWALRELGSRVLLRGGRRAFASTTGPPRWWPRWRPRREPPLHGVDLAPMARSPPSPARVRSLRSPASPRRRPMA